MIEAFGLSDIGPVRDNNEDCLLSDLVLNLFVVADGMGGQAGGEIASRIAVETIEEFIELSGSGECITWPFGLDPTLSEGANRLKTALLLANMRILQCAESSDGYEGMGTTAVCALLSGSELTIAHVGDSRLYIYSDGTLTPMTRDDSWAALAGTAVGDDPAQADGSLDTPPGPHVLTNVLGGETPVEIHLCERRLSGGELLMMCSDGLHGAVEDETIGALLGSSDDLETLVQALVSTALAQGTRDNVTALLVRYSSNRERGM